jgi:hypothetical protein
MYDAYTSDVLGVPVWSSAIEQRAPPLRPRLHAGGQAVRVRLRGGHPLPGRRHVYTDNGAAIAFELDTRHFFKDYDRVTVDEIIADFETGVGIAVGQGVDPQS